MRLRGQGWSSCRFFIMSSLETKIASALEVDEKFCHCLSICLFTSFSPCECEVPTDVLKGNLPRINTLFEFSFRWERFTLPENAILSIESYKVGISFVGLDAFTHPKKWVDHSSTFFQVFGQKASLFRESKRRDHILECPFVLLIEEEERIESFFFLSKERHFGQERWEFSEAPSSKENDVRSPLKVTNHQWGNWLP